MKSAINMIIICLVILSLSAGCAYLMHMQSHELMDICETMLSSIEEGEDEKALQTLESLQGKYDKYSHFWQMTIEHETIEHVSEHIKELETDLLYGVTYMARRDCALLIEAIESINENLWPHFGNIL